jgi:mannose-6-phosphate isomerase-like protein (cupin superfamily)
VNTTSVAESPVNRRGGQSSHLLLSKGQFGSRQLAITWVDCPPGSEQPVHLHTEGEQVYVIVRGSGTMTFGDETRQVQAGTLVFIPPGTGHAIRNDGPDALTYVSATAPPFEVPELGDVFAFSEVALAGHRVDDERTSGLEDREAEAARGAEGRGRAHRQLDRPLGLAAASGENV